MIPPLPLARTPWTCSEAALASSPDVELASSMIPNTSADSAPDGPPVAALAGLAVVGARLGWRRRGVARSGRVERVRAAILRRTAVSVLIGGVGNQSIPKSALRDGQAKNTATGFRVLNDQLLCWCETGVV